MRTIQTIQNNNSYYKPKIDSNNKHIGISSNTTTHLWTKKSKPNLRVPSNKTYWLDRNSIENYDPLPNSIQKGKGKGINKNKGFKGLKPIISNNSNINNIITKKDFKKLIGTGTKEFIEDIDYDSSSGDTFGLGDSENEIKTDIKKNDFRDDAKNSNSKIAKN